MERETCSGVMKLKTFPADNDAKNMQSKQGWIGPQETPKSPLPRPQAPASLVSLDNSTSSPPILAVLLGTTLFSTRYEAVAFIAEASSFLRGRGSEPLLLLHGDPSPSSTIQRSREVHRLPPISNGLQGVQAGSSHHSGRCAGRGKRHSSRASYEAISPTLSCQLWRSIAQCSAQQDRIR